MELFERAKVVRLRNEKGMYLTADTDERSVIQHGDGSSKAARWSVELSDRGLIRLKSCYGNYLTAKYDYAPFSFTGLFHGGCRSHRKHKVVQTMKQVLDDCTVDVDWEPVRAHHSLVKLRSCHGTFLRSNGPRLSVTHDDVAISSRHHHQQSKAMLWDVAITEILPTWMVTDKIPPPAPAPPLQLEFERPPPLSSLAARNRTSKKYYCYMDSKTGQATVVVCTVNPFNGKLQIEQKVPLLFVK